MTALALSPANRVIYAQLSPEDKNFFKPNPDVFHLRPLDRQFDAFMQGHLVARSGTRIVTATPVSTTSVVPVRTAAVQQSAQIALADLSGVVLSSEQEIIFQETASRNSLVSREVQRRMFIRSQLPSQIQTVSTSASQNVAEASPAAKANFLKKVYAVVSAASGAFLSTKIILALLGLAVASSPIGWAILAVGLALAVASLVVLAYRHNVMTQANLPTDTTETFFKTGVKQGIFWLPIKIAEAGDLGSKAAMEVIDGDYEMIDSNVTQTSANGR